MRDWIWSLILAHFGIYLGISLRPFWHSWRPQVANMGAKGATKMAPKRTSERDLKTAPFWSLPGEPEVRSRLDGSTVFMMSPVSLLDPILGSFWDRFGSQGCQFSHQEALEGPPEAVKTRLVKPRVVRAMEINANQAEIKSRQGQSLSIL